MIDFSLSSFISGVSIGIIISYLLKKQFGNHMKNNEIQVLQAEKEELEVRLEKKNELIELAIRESNKDERIVSK